MQQADPAAVMAASLASIERRARRAMDALDVGGARNGRTALLAIATEAGDARRHASDAERERERFDHGGELVPGAGLAAAIATAAAA